MTIKFRVLESFKKLKNNITKQVIDVANKFTKSNLPTVGQYVYNSIYSAIYNCPEMESVRTGILKADFGLDFDPTDAIADSIARSISVTIRKSDINKGLVSGYLINVQPLSYLNLLSLPESVVITEKDERLPWLEWLTLYGDSVIIYDYGVKYKNNAGRSKMGIMIQSSRFFKVNEQYSGVASDNFITRAIGNPEFTSGLQSGITNLLR